MLWMSYLRGGNPQFCAKEINESVKLGGFHLLEIAPPKDTNV